MWNINRDSEVQIHELMGSKIYTVDNFLQQPRKLERFLFNRNSFPVQGDPWGMNMKEYVKQRYSDWIDESCPIVAVAQHLCKQSVGKHGGFETNVEAWRISAYNDITNNYWFPHIDNGYTCIIYFNNNMTGGTNLYHPKLKDEKWFQDLMKEVPLGQNPWIPKKDVELLHTLTPRYNRMVLFDGNKFPHGTAITDESYMYGATQLTTNSLTKFSRRNLCFFFYPENDDNKKES